MIARLLGAIQFLTIIPIHRRTAEPGRSALFFPLVGAALGIAGGYALELSRGYVPWQLSALLVLAFWTLITGGLHEDAVADVADAFRAWRPPEQIHRILKDSRIGAHGAAALVFLFLIRWQALASMSADPVQALAASLAVSRAAAVGLIWIAPPAGGGSATELSNSLSTPTVFGAIAQGILFALWPGARVAGSLLGIAAATVLLARNWFERRIGGITGDCIGATQQVVETLCLILFACAPCTK
jgi:adenosylcobinamide-GDP ribazoletransferase